MSSKVIAGRYELLEKIGDGGMAVVYKARCRLLNRFVALKILKPEFTKDAKFIENFRRESHAAASLSHPNIVSIYDVGREGNINYIVMELVEGMTLSDIIEKEAPMNYRQVIEVTKQIASGLAVAHKHGIIHRDIKPHNILINREGIAKIADFGIAKATGTTTIVSGTNETVMGSVHYFSPEQARGSYVDEKTDIYSLGIVMYEMLTGRVPFDGDNPVTVALMHINEEITPPSQLVEGIPPQLEKIVMKATDKYQTNRFKKAEDIIDELNNIELVTRVVGDKTYVAVPTAGTATGAVRAAQERELRNASAKEEDASSAAKGDGKKDEGTGSSGGGDKKKKRRVVIAAIIAVLLIAGLITAFALGAFSKGNVQVPDVRGMTYEQAEKRLTEEGLKIKEGDHVFSAKYEEGEITSQDPDASAKVKKGAVVTVNISKGPSEEAVPDLIGLSEDEAREKIKKYNFEVGSVNVARSDKPEGTVIDQDPKAGTELTTGSVINFTVSDGKGKGEGTVPDIKGMTVSAAKKAITDAGFTPGEVTYDISNTYAKDKVMSQEYAPGTVLEKGNSISFVVSIGPSPEINLYVDFEDAKEEVFYMTVTVSDDNGTRNIISNAQRNKSKGGETLNIKGSGTGTITVIFDDEVVKHYNADFTKGEVS